MDDLDIGVYLRKIDVLAVTGIRGCRTIAFSSVMAIQMGWRITFWMESHSCLATRMRATSLCRCPRSSVRSSCSRTPKTQCTGLCTRTNLDERSRKTTSTFSERRTRSMVHDVISGSSSCSHVVVASKATCRVSTCDVEGWELTTHHRGPHTARNGDAATPGWTMCPWTGWRIPSFTRLRGLFFFISLFFFVLFLFVSLYSLSPSPSPTMLNSVRSGSLNVLDRCMHVCGVNDRERQIKHSEK